MLSTFQLLCIGQFQLRAQSTVQTNFKNVFNPVYPSPTASSLGKYADIPISYHTGVPNISVPLYTINEGDLSLPISLSYHAAGIRVDEISSPIGLGWSLNAGGMISRTVNGGPDEGYTHTKAITNKAGWGWYKDGNFPPEINNCFNKSWDAWRMYNSTVDSIGTHCIINEGCSRVLHGITMQPWEPSTLNPICTPLTSTAIQENSSLIPTRRHILLMLLTYMWNLLILPATSQP